MFLHRFLPGSSLPCRLLYATTLHCSWLLRHPVVSDLALLLRHRRVFRYRLIYLHSIVTCLLSYGFAAAWLLHRRHLSHCSTVRLVGQLCFHSGAGGLSVSSPVFRLTCLVCAALRPVLWAVRPRRCTVRCDISTLVVLSCLNDGLTSKFSRGKTL